MGKDTIQNEDAVSTISEEYLLEFTSEYGIPESLHPELPDPKEPIVEFPKGKVSVYTKFFEFANYRIPISQLIFDILGYYQIHLSQLSVIGIAKVSHFEINCRVLNIIPTLNLFRVFYVPSNNSSASNPAKVKTGTRARASHEVPLLTVTVSRVIDMEDTAVASGSLGTPSTLEKSPLDFANVDPLQMITEIGGMKDQVVQEPGLEKEVAAMGPPVNKRRRKRGNDEAEANAPPKVLRKDHAAFRPE
ncbi:hypothetical protein Tco_0071593 [Tanacetum coccineum]